MDTNSIQVTLPVPEKKKKILHFSDGVEEVTDSEDDGVNTGIQSETDGISPAVDEVDYNTRFLY